MLDSRAFVLTRHTRPPTRVALSHDLSPCPDATTCVRASLVTPVNVKVTRERPRAALRWSTTPYISDTQVITVFVERCKGSMILVLYVGSSMYFIRLMKQFYVIIRRVQCELYRCARACHVASRNSICSLALRFNLDSYFIILHYILLILSLWYESSETSWLFVFHCILFNMAE